MTLPLHLDTFNTYTESLCLSKDLLMTHFQQLPEHQQTYINQLLHIAHRYQLDILAGEISLTDYENGHTQVHISIDGWTQLIHRQDQFCGLQFSEANTLNEGVPEWMTCSIYRKDLILPIVVKEYFSEVKTEERIWQVMPRRMLRHRALQQCARLAFGFSGSELICDRPMKERIQSTTKLDKKASRTEKLKSIIQNQMTTQSNEVKLVTPGNSTIKPADLGPRPSGS